jgi:hypothetical protein
VDDLKTAMADLKREMRQVVWLMAANLGLTFINFLKVYGFF